MAPGATTQSLLRQLNYELSGTDLDNFRSLVYGTNKVTHDPKLEEFRSWLLEDWHSTEYAHPAWRVNEPKNIKEYEKFPVLYLERKYAQPCKRQTIGFMDLSPELRLMVYQLLLRSDKPFELWSGMWEPRDAIFSGIWKSRNATWSHFARYKHVLHVLRLSKEIRNEATSVFWGENEFRMSALNSFIICDTFFLTIGDFNVRFLRKLTLDTSLGSERVYNAFPKYQNKAIKLMADRGMSVRYPDNMRYPVGMDAVTGVLRTFHRLANDGGVDLKELQLLWPCGTWYGSYENFEERLRYVNRLKESIEDLRISLILYHGNCSTEENKQHYGHSDDWRARWNRRKSMKDNNWLLGAALDMGWPLRECYGLDDEHGRYTVLDAGAIKDDTVTSWFDSYLDSDSDSDSDYDDDDY